MTTGTPLKVPLLDLDAQYSDVGPDIEAAVLDVLRSGRYILGPRVAELEERLAVYCGTPFAVGVSSGTDALLMALMAQDVGPGDEVITTTYSFFATAGAIDRVGATPRFVDIEPETFNIDPAAAMAAVTPLTKAIIVVHLFGQCASMGPFLELSERTGIPIIEDAAQAIGATWEGRPAGSMGRMGCFSFFPSKNLGGAGDGGLVTTRDATLAEKLRRLRNHGSHPKYHHAMIGGNFRLDEIQAAILLAKLGRLDDWTEKRQANARAYRTLLAPAVERGMVQLPVEAPGRRHVWNQFTILAESGRDRITSALDAAGIGWAVYYPVCLHLQECFADLGGRTGDCPMAEKASKHALSLPVYPELSRRQLEYVAEVICHS